MREVKKISDLTTTEKKLIYYIYVYDNEWSPFRYGSHSGQYDNMNEKIRSYIANIIYYNSEIPEAIQNGFNLSWKIVDFLSTKPNIEIHATEVADKFNEEMHTVVGYLFKMSRIGLVKDRMVGDKRYYKFEEECVTKINNMLSELDKYLTAYNNLPNNVEDINVIIDKYKNEFDFSDLNYDSKKLTENNEKLIDYMKNIVALDSDIFSLKQRYNTLSRQMERLIIKDYFEDFIKANDEADTKISELENDIEDLNKKIKNKPILRENIKINLPKKPQFKLNKPEEPILKKSNLFNKKKVEEENRKLLQQFDTDMLIYSKEYEKYTNELDNYNKEVKRIKEDNMRQNKKLYEKELKNYNKEVKDYKLILEQKNAEMHNLLDEKPKKVEEIFEKYDGYKRFKALEYELEYIVENIKRDIELQNKMYSYNIIYGKYRNYIAMSSFIDYFISGRCSTLDTNTGAYNLFEQESRMEIIINKLDTIIVSLEKIKENQYYIYNQLNSINKSLESIDKQLLVNNILQVVQTSKLDEIIDNTNEIAYNTEVSAYYAKKTANYTKAIAFMEFIDRL